MPTVSEHSVIELQREAPVPAGRVFVQTATLEQCIADPKRQMALNELIKAGHVPVFKGVARRDELDSLIGQLHGVMLNSFEQYVPIRHNAPNYMRLSFGDDRAAVPLWMASWSFFSWNRDLFLLHRRFAPVYQLRNLMNGLAPDTFISRRVDHGFAARIAVHFYPTGKGMLGSHIDPLGKQQTATATLVMSSRGRDFTTGGFYLEREHKNRLYIEDEMEVGDLYFCNPACVHGVETVDASSNYDPVSRSGRWNMVFPVSKAEGEGEKSIAID